MDLITTLASVPAVGPYLPYVTVAVTVAAAVATILPPPSSKPTFAAGAYALLYHAVQWLGLNKGKAANANAP